MSQIHGATLAPAAYRPRRLLVLAAAVAVAGVLTAAGYAGYRLTHGAVPVPTIGCYETDSLEANTAGLVRGTDSPVAACAGAYASAFPHTQVPARFAACVLPSGSIGVFPSDAEGGTCKSLGLTEAP